MSEPLDRLKPLPARI